MWWFDSELMFTSRSNDHFFIYTPTRLSDIPFLLIEA